MEGIIAGLLAAAVLATLGVLVVGIVGMAKGGEFNKRYSNKLMRLRILTQGVSIVLFIILMVVSGKS
jgi:hypothetical protein